MHDDDRLPEWGFAFPGRARNELTAPALAGTRTATTGLLVEYELEAEQLPQPGERQVLVDSDGQGVATVETASCRVVRLADVDDEHARDEGEGRGIGRALLEHAVAVAGADDLPPMTCR